MKSNVKYTVTHNHGEYAEGLFDSLEAAEAEVIKQTRACCDEVEDSWTDEEVFYYMDGYFSPLEITF